jgi:uncharacterized RDD family membrane protein YckC
LKTIEINTTQNVKIEYQLASVTDRIIAYAIDFVLMGIGFLILFFFVSSFFESSIDIITQIIAFIWFGFFTLGSEIIGNGQTIGKKAMGIKIIKLNGDELEFYDYFNRWVMRLLDIYFTIGTLAILFVVGNKSSQRLGDILAGTTVIKKQNAYGFKLADILKLNQKSKELSDFKYPLVHKLSERDVILIKNTIYRNQLYPNEAHQESLNLLTEKVIEILEIDEQPKNQRAFLNQVISEYIIQTR